MRLLLFITAVFLTFGCEKAAQQEAVAAAGAGNLTQQEQWKADDFKKGLEMTDLEVNDIGAEMEAYGITENEPLVAPDPVDYLWFKRIEERLNHLQSYLKRIFNAYYQLPGKLREVVEPGLAVHLKFSHGRFLKFQNGKLAPN